MIGNPEINLRRLRAIIKREYSATLRMAILKAIEPMTDSDIEQAIGDAMSSQSRCSYGQALVSFCAGLAVFLSDKQDQDGDLRVKWKDIRSIIERYFTPRQQHAVQFALRAFRNSVGSELLADIRLRNSIDACLQAFIGKSRKWGVVGCAAALAITIDSIKQSQSERDGNVQAHLVHIN